MTRRDTLRMLPTLGIAALFKPWAWLKPRKPRQRWVWFCDAEEWKLIQFVKVGDTVYRHYDSSNTPDRVGRVVEINRREGYVILEYTQ